MHPYLLHFLRLLGISVFFVLGAMLRLGGGPEALFLSLWWVIKTVPVLMLLMVFNRYGGAHGLGRVMMLAAAVLGFAFGWAVRDLGDVAMWSVAPAACVVVVVLDVIIGHRYRLWAATAAASQGAGGAQASP